MPPKWTYLILICLPEILGVLIELVNFKSNLFNFPVENFVLANLFTFASLLNKFLNPRFYSAEISTRMRSFSAEF